MVIIGMLSYPPEQSKEVGKRFGEIPPLPAYMTMKGPYLSSEIGVGMKAIAIYEFDQSKTKEAILYVGERYTIYLGIPGFTNSIQIWLEAPEALKMIGLA